MARILHLSEKAPSKFGFKRASKRRRKDPEEHGQLNLFHSPPAGSPARILPLPSRLSPFEEALNRDEHGDRMAQELYRKAIEEGDRIADAYCNLGILESQAGRTQQAVDCFTESLREEPRHFEAHYNLANLYFDAGDLRLARLHYEVAAQLEPESPNTYFNLALVLAMSGEYIAAVNALRKYKELVPEDEAGKANALLTDLKRSLSDNG